jgi:hypothetical protein
MVGDRLKCEFRVNGIPSELGSPEDGDPGAGCDAGAGGKAGYAGGLFFVVGGGGAAALNRVLSSSRSSPSG